MSANEQYAEHQIEQLQELLDNSLAWRWTESEDAELLIELIEAAHQKLDKHLYFLLGTQDYKKAKETAKYALAGIEKARTKEEGLALLDEVWSLISSDQF